MSFLKSIQIKILSRQILFVVILLGFTLFLGLFLKLAFQKFNLSITKRAQNDLGLFVENVTATSEQEQVNFGLPVRLTIPQINVDVTIENVGVTPTGAMDVPKNPDNVAWFELGQRPGENGSAVIAGHYGWKNGRVVAFDNLYKLHKGDKLYIKDDKGNMISFVVRESRMYGQNEDASSIFSSNDGEAHLNLITCNGIWNKVQKSYSQRLVIFADRITE